MNKILLVDDDENILAGFRRNLRNEYQVFTAISAANGLEILDDHKDIMVVVSDYNMPEIKGIDFLSAVKNKLPNTIGILLTGNADLHMAINALNSGAIFRFLTKPIELENLKNVISSGITQYKLLTSEKELLEKTLKGSIKVLIDILAVASPNIFNRSILFRDLAKKILDRLKIVNVWEIEIACLLSQIGCIGIPSELIEKKMSGKQLTKVEEEMFFSQAQIGKSLLQNIPRLEKIANAIVYQYKSLDDINLIRDEISDETILLIPKLLKLLNDYMFLLEKGIKEENITTFLNEEKHLYDPLLLSALEAEILEAQSGYLFESVKLSQLKAGMILADHLYDKNNIKILSKGIVLSDIFITKLKNLATTMAIKEPIKIFYRT